MSCPFTLPMLSRGIRLQIADRPRHGISGPEMIGRLQRQDPVLVKSQQRYEKRHGRLVNPFRAKALRAGGAPDYRADSSGEFWELQNCRNSLKNRML
jgi:hypothetical protein